MAPACFFFLGLLQASDPPIKLDLAWEYYVAVKFKLSGQSRKNWIFKKIKTAAEKMGTCIFDLVSNMGRDVHKPTFT
jgi:hypothetical protein